MTEAATADDGAGESRDPQPFLDAHAHFWDLGTDNYPWLCGRGVIPFRYGDYTPLKRDYLPADFRRDAAAFTLAGMVHIEAKFDPDRPLAETRWLEDLAAETGLPTVCVGQVDMAAPDAAEVLAGHAASPLIRGVRSFPAAADSAAEAKRGAPGSMDDPAYRAAMPELARHGLSLDIQVVWWHLDALAELAADFPEVQIVLNHTGLPANRSAEGLAGWRRAMERAAQGDNVALKISGLGIKGRAWRLEDQEPVILDALAIFGTERCLFASNYPVDSLVGDYRSIIGGYRRATRHLAPEAVAGLFHDNAARVYRVARKQGRRNA